MAGIGEASAIISVAQAGISLSKTIISLIGEVRDAPSAIVRIGREIQSTSGRLKEIGDLIEHNESIRLFSDEGLTDAARCSYQCDLILAQVGALLVKGGWTSGSTALDKNDIDISWFTTLKWPWLKTRLESPRAELQIVKADLNLLFTSAMARKSSDPMMSEYALEIPNLTKIRDWTTRKAEEAKRRARERQQDEKGLPGTSQAETDRPRQQSRLHYHDDPEIYRQFEEFEQQKAREREQRKALERLAFLQAEEESKRRKEEEARLVIEQKAVEDYKREQQKQQEMKAAREDQFKTDLAALRLDPSTVDSILGISSLNIHDHTRHDDREVKPAKPEESVRDSTLEESKTKAKKRNKFGLPFHGQRTKAHSRDESEEPIPTLNDGLVDIKPRESNLFVIEAWLLDVISRHQTELQPAVSWCTAKHMEKRQGPLWQSLARLQPEWRIALQDFLITRNRTEIAGTKWKLVDLGLPRRWSKMGVFGHTQKAHLIRVFIARSSIGSNARTEKGDNLHPPGSIDLLATKRGQHGLDQDLQNPTMSSHKTEKMLKRSEKDDKDHGKERKIMDLSHPMYIKVHRKYLLPETLDEYDLPWEWDERDSDYILIKRWISEHLQEDLFEHTKKLRARGQGNTGKVPIANMSRYSGASTSRPPAEGTTSFPNSGDPGTNRNAQELIAQVIVFKADPMLRFDGATYLHRDLVAPAAILELDYSFQQGKAVRTPLELELDLDTHEFIPRAMDLADIDELVHLTLELRYGRHDLDSTYQYQIYEYRRPGFVSLAGWYRVVQSSDQVPPNHPLKEKATVPQVNALSFQDTSRNERKEKPDYDPYDEALFSIAELRLILREWASQVKSLHRDRANEELFDSIDGLEKRLQDSRRPGKAISETAKEIEYGRPVRPPQKHHEGPRRADGPLSSPMARPASFERERPQNPKRVVFKDTVQRPGSVLTKIYPWDESDIRRSRDRSDRGRYNQPEYEEEEVIIRRRDDRDEEIEITRAREDERGRRRDVGMDRKEDNFKVRERERERSRGIEPEYERRWSDVDDDFYYEGYYRPRRHRERSYDSDSDLDITSRRGATGSPRSSRPHNDELVLRRQDSEPGPSHDGNISQATDRPERPSFELIKYRDNRMEYPVSAHGGYSSPTRLQRTRTSSSERARRDPNQTALVLRRRDSDVRFPSRQTTWDTIPSRRPTGDSDIRVHDFERSRPKSRATRPRPTSKVSFHPRTDEFLHSRPATSYRSPQPYNSFLDSPIIVPDTDRFFSEPLRVSDLGDFRAQKNDEADKDLIAKTLQRYTTFKADGPKPASPSTSPSQAISVLEVPGTSGLTTSQDGEAKLKGNDIAEKDQDDITLAQDAERRKGRPKHTSQSSSPSPVPLDSTELKIRHKENEGSSKSETLQRGNTEPPPKSNAREPIIAADATAEGNKSPHINGAKSDALGEGFESAEEVQRGLRSPEDEMVEVIEYASPRSSNDKHPSEWSSNDSIYDE